MLASLGAFGVLFAESRGEILRLLSDRYVRFQLAISALFILSGLRSANVPYAMFRSLHYVVTFVVNYVVLAYLFRRGFRSPFVRVLIGVVAAASVIGVLEGIFKDPIAFYASLSSVDANGTPLVVAIGRVAGTLGNPIVYATALALAVPFVCELSSGAIRLALFGLMLTASAFAASGTAVVIWLLWLLGVVQRASSLPRKVRGFTVLVLAVLAANSVLTSTPLGLGQESAVNSLLETKDTSISLRMELARMGWNHFMGQDVLGLLLGGGLGSSAALILSQGWLDWFTLDNAYITLLVESGLIGLLAYLSLCAFVLAKAPTASAHWYSVLALMVAGFGFVTFSYASFNLIWVASIATLRLECGGVNVYLEGAEARRRTLHRARQAAVRA
jgi:hypothetical protein